MKCCSCVYRNGSNGGARGGKLKAEPAEGLTTESLPHRTFAGGLRRHGQERGAFDGARSRSEAAAGAGAGTALREPPSAAFVRRTDEIGELRPQLYVYELGQGDFDIALRGLLGERA